MIINSKGSEMKKLIRCVVIMLGLILPLKMEARMYPSQITVPAVCFSDPRELYIYQEMILGETLVAAAKTLKTVNVEDQGWIVIFYNKEKDTWSLAGIVATEACVLMVGHGWETIPLEKLPPGYKTYLESPKIPEPTVPKVSNDDALEGKL